MGRELGQHWRAGREIHQYPNEHHGVGNLASRDGAKAPDRAVPQHDPVPDQDRLDVQCGPQDRAHIGIGFDRHHVMAGPGQPNGLRSLASTHIKHTSRMLRHVPAQLTRDHLLPDHVANVVQPAEPGRPADTEGAVTSGVGTNWVSGTHHRAKLPALPVRQAAVPRPGGTRSA
jgi:hypothetical protein